jgi:excisionase family DNA binding protein
MGAKKKNTKEPKERMMTVKEAAKEIGAGESSIRLWAKNGKLSGAILEKTPAGNYWLIPESSVKAFKKGSPGRKPGSPNKPKDQPSNS